MDFGLPIKLSPFDRQHTATSWSGCTTTDTYGVEPVELDNVSHEKSIFVYNNHEDTPPIRFASMTDDQLLLHLLKGWLIGQVLDVPVKVNEDDKKEYVIIVWGGSDRTLVR